MDIQDTTARPARPAARSRRRLRSALLSALHVQNYEEITLSDLLQAADVGRSTFYAHFHGKDALLRQSLRTLQAEIRESISAVGAHPMAFSAALIEHAAQHRDVFRRLRGRGREIAMKELDALVADFIRAARRASGAPPGAADDATIQFLKGGFLALLTWWLDHPSPLAASDVEQLARRLVEDAAAP